MKTLANMKFWLGCAAMILLSLTSDAVTRVSVSSGNWSDGSTWSPTGVPACGDSIVIQSGHTIDITTQQNYSGCTEPMIIIVYGRFKFRLGSKLSLPCDSYVIVYPGGMIEHDQGFASSNLINICDTVEWNSNNNLPGLACLPESHPICSQVLPIELTLFESRNATFDMVSLYWVTATETNADYFILEHSVDGFIWQPVCSMEAIGNSSNSSYYFFDDHEPVSGQSYYRLTGFDLDGQSHVFSPLAVYTYPQSDFGIQAAPNPFLNDLTIIFAENESETVRFEMYDMMGRLMTENTFKGNAERYYWKFDRELPEGMYILKVYSDEIPTGSVSLIRN